MSINNLEHITNIVSSTARNNTLENIAPESPRHSTDTIASITELNSTQCLRCLCSLTASPQHARQRNDHETNNCYASTFAIPRLSIAWVSNRDGVIVVVCLSSSEKCGEPLSRISGSHAESPPASGACTRPASLWSFLPQTGPCLRKLQKDLGCTLGNLFQKTPNILESISEIPLWSLGGLSGHREKVVQQYPQSNPKETAT